MSMRLHDLLTLGSPFVIQGLDVKPPAKRLFGHAKPDTPSKLRLEFADRKQAKLARDKIRASKPQSEQKIIQTDNTTLTLPFADLLLLLEIHSIVDDRHLQEIRNLLEQLGTCHAKKATVEQILHRVLLGERIETSIPMADEPSAEEEEKLESVDISLDENQALRDWTLNRCPFEIRYNIQFMKAFGIAHGDQLVSAEMDEAQTLCPGQIKLTFHTSTARNRFKTELTQRKAAAQPERPPPAHHLPDAQSIVVDQHDLFYLYPNHAAADEKIAISAEDYLNYIRNLPSSDPLTRQFNDLLAQLKSTQNYRVMGIDPTAGDTNQVQIHFASKADAEFFLDNLLYSDRLAPMKPRIKRHSHVLYSYLPYRHRDQWDVTLPATALQRLLPESTTVNPTLLDGTSARDFLDHLQDQAMISRTTQHNPYSSPSQAEEHIRRMFNLIKLPSERRLPKQMKRPPRLQVAQVSISKTGEVTMRLSADSSEKEVARFEEIYTNAGIILAPSKSKNHHYTFSFDAFKRLTYWLHQHPTYCSPDVSLEFQQLSHIVAQQQTTFEIESSVNAAEVHTEMQEVHAHIFDGMCRLFRGDETSPSLHIDGDHTALQTERPPLHMRLVPAMKTEKDHQTTYTPAGIVTRAYPDPEAFHLTDQTIVEALTRHIQAELIKEYYRTGQKKINVSLTIETNNPELLERAKKLAAEHLPQQLTSTLFDPNLPDQPVTLTLAQCQVNGESWLLAAPTTKPAAPEEHADRGPPISLTRR